MGWSSNTGWTAAERGSGWSGAPGAMLWTPALFPNVVALWDAASGITLDGSNNVSTWTPQVAPASAITQSAASSRPGYSATARGGSPGLILSGAQTLSGSPVGFPGNDAVSFLFVSAYITANGTLFSYGKLGLKYLRALQVSSGNVQGSDGATAYPSGVSVLNTDICAAWTFGSGNSSLSVNSGAPATAAPAAQSTVVVGTQASGVLSFLGAYMNGSDNPTGVIKTILIGSSAPSASDRQKLEGWDSWHTGLAGSNLPAGHPFKSRAPLTTD